MTKIITLFLTTVFSVHAYALSVSNLEFQATQICPAYLSKKTQSNPNNLKTKVSTVYPVREINKNFPDWLRIEMPDEHALRWVSAACGVTQQNVKAAHSCDNAGAADSYVLALSSQPGFCETYGYEAGKPECLQLKKDSYQAKHLTLHGLWPNVDECGQHYGYCGVRPQINHCNYEPVDLTLSTASKLKKLMPSFAYGSCLERHEWYKHGSCQILYADEYFSLAMRLATEVDQSMLGAYLTQHHGKTVSLRELRTVVGKTFGASNSKKVYLSCKNGTLVDIYIQLPALLPPDESLINLITQAPSKYPRDTCGLKVKISNFTKDYRY